MIDVFSFKGLAIAASKNYPELLEMLLNTYEIDVNLKTLVPENCERPNFLGLFNGSSYITALMIACKERNPNIVKRLLKLENINLLCTDRYGRNVLHYAAIYCGESTKLLAAIPGKGGDRA